MSDLQECFARQAEENRHWFKKNKYFIKILGFSFNDAVSQRSLITSILNDLKGYFKAFKIFILIAILILILLICIQHTMWKADSNKLFITASIYSGLLGTFWASYGFLFNLRSLDLKQQKSTIFFPHIPRDTSGFPRYAASLNKIIGDYINSQAEEKVHMINVEIRKQISLAFGFFLLVVSFIIQMVLQFF